jgi:hypothetical protein
MMRINSANLFAMQASRRARYHASAKPHVDQTVGCDPLSLGRCRRVRHHRRARRVASASSRAIEAAVLLRESFSLWGERLAAVQAITHNQGMVANDSTNTCFRNSLVGTAKTIVFIGVSGL